MPQNKKILRFILSCLIILFISIPVQTKHARADFYVDFVILSQYSTIADIGNEFYVIAVTSTGDLPTWVSSNSKVASVNTYGKVTAKKAGTTKITAKIKGAEASCKLIVAKTEISISKKSISLERNDLYYLSATTSNGSQVTWKSNKKSIATIDEYGNITANKPGDAIITATADGSSITCKVKVKSPVIKLDTSSIKLYRGNLAKLSATVSSGVIPVWKSNKKSVATVDENGTITAIKHGTATITATVDGISKSCEVKVEQPTIKLSSTELTLKEGDTAIISAVVSSGNLPEWSSSNQNVAIIDSTGIITALSIGRAYLYATEDGVKIRCVLYVTE
ncbi:MAG: Ig-like domain-containing protein [Mobilitalea sp.]